MSAQHSRIAVIGVPSQREPVIRAARSAGFEAHSFSWQSGEGVEEFAACEGADSANGVFHAIGMQDSDAILSVCRELDVSAVVPVGSGMAAKSAALVAQALGLPGNSPAAVEAANNKVASRLAFLQAGLKQPAFVQVQSGIPQELFKLHMPLVVKPADRSGCRAVRVVRNRGELFSAIDAARDMSYKNEAIVEEYVDGQLISCECMSFSGQHVVLAITRRTVKLEDGVFCEARYEQPSGLSPALERAARDAALSALQALGLSCGASSVELFVTPDGNVLLNEVTPTLYGDYVGVYLTQLSTGADCARMVVDAALGRAPELPLSFASDHAQVSFVYGAGDLTALSTADSNDVVMSTVDAVAQKLPSGGTRRFGCFILRRQQRAFGGVPALELPQGSGLPPHLASVPHRCLLALNSEVAAFRYALKASGAQRVWIPWYAAPAWEKAALSCGLQVNRYFISEDFLPLGLSVAAQSDAVLLPNHHAQCGQWIRLHAGDYACCIIDNSAAFYEPPVMAPGVWNVYSPRKFFAIPDGGYLVSASLDASAPRPERDVSYRRARMLLMSLELGEDAPYKERMANEQELIANPKGMSALTQRMICAIEHNSARVQREMNYTTLNARLGGVQQLRLSTDANAVPQFYPLLVSGDIRAQLVESKVFVPQMWRHLLDVRFGGTTEKHLAQNLLCLPIDQRYSVEDMEHIARIVTSLL